MSQRSFHLDESVNNGNILNYNAQEFHPYSYASLNEISKTLAERNLDHCNQNGVNYRPSTPVNDYYYHQPQPYYNANFRYNDADRVIYANLSSQESKYFHQINNYQNVQNLIANNRYDHYMDNDHNNNYVINSSRSTSSASSISSSSSSLIDKRQLPLPPKENLMYHPSRYKTEICRQFEELGYCKYQESCLFAHGKYELRELPNRHPKHKTERCLAYHEQGFCTFGPRCSFVHEKIDAEKIINSLQKKIPKLPMPKPKSSRKNQQMSTSVGDYLIGDEEFNKIKSVLNKSKRLPTFQSIFPSKVKGHLNGH